MIDSRPLGDMLHAAAGGRGVAALAVIEGLGGQARTWSVPASMEEPAFLVYSITKTFTAALVLSLCESGRLALDDRLSTWFPRISNAQHITLRRLLDHTAGIPDYGRVAAYHAGVRESPSAPWTFERFAAETFDKGLLFEPGQGWAYSNPGYMLLKRILEEVSGLTYRTLVADRIAGPLNLRRTFVAESLADLSTLARGNSSALSTDGSPREARTHYHPGWVSHGVVASTASDLVRFMDALWGGRLLSAASLAQMTHWVAVPTERFAVPPSAAKGTPSYGLGVMGSPDSAFGRIAGHNGGGPCYTASAWHAFDRGGVSVAALGAIEEGFNAEALVFDVLDRLVDPGDR